MLFSSMTIRDVGRAAFLIVNECRVQFRDKEIWAGTKKPNYGRVVDICTSTAQKELVGKISGFLGQAHEAILTDDWVRAQNLAEKARVLSVELTKSF